MIVRSSFKCITCGQAHTIRIGMGHEARQTHRLQCIKCGEDMVVALNVDFQKFRHWTEAVENAELAIEEAGAPIINIEANFIIPDDKRHEDMAFPRLTQLMAMIENAGKHGSLVSAANIPIGMANLRPYRRPDYAEEWRMLKKAWSLHSRGQDVLTQKKIASASDLLYKSAPLHSLLDWLWRFTMFISQPHYEAPFRAAIEVVRPIMRKPGFMEFARFYDDTAKGRGERYFNLMKEYFNCYDDFSRVHFYVAKGMDVPPGNVSSIDFDATRMFYGNAFEDFASSVDILAYLTNLKVGRQFHQFEKLTQEQYLRLDKSSRFQAFAAVPEFTVIGEERDNQIRNASHHGGMKLKKKTQTIHYTVGKGGTGTKQRMAYSTYLARSAKLFLQAMTLLRLEIMMGHATGMRPPL